MKPGKWVVDEQKPSASVPRTRGYSYPYPPPGIRTDATNVTVVKKAEGEERERKEMEDVELGERKVERA